MNAQLADSTFQKYRELVYKLSGIHLNELKKQLVASRLIKRLRHYGNIGYDEYYKLCLHDHHEQQLMIDTITTNETSFFRESHHFEFLKKTVLPQFKQSKFRVWSAAASIGAEAYSLAMTLDETLTPMKCRWEVVGTDINTEVIRRAKEGLYPIEYAKPISTKYLKSYCLEGINSQKGFFLIDDYLRQQCHFLNANLMNHPPKEIGEFDVIFLRNMLIYFDNQNKQIIVENVLRSLKKGGYLFIGHSETLTNITKSVRQVKPTIYIKD